MRNLRRRAPPRRRTRISAPPNLPKPCESFPGHREVVVLRYYENMKIHEIASHAGVSVGTVKSRLHYAVRSLERLVPGELNLFAAEGTHNQATP